VAPAVNASTSSGSVAHVVADDDAVGLGLTARAKASPSARVTRPSSCDPTTPRMSFALTMSARICG
jgi:hypothetical protein